MIHGYFDYNSTAPLGDAARAVLCGEAPWGNPGALHSVGLAASRVLEDARSRLAQGIGGSAGRIVFTSGATEGIAGIIAHWAQRFPGKKIILSPFEHASAVMNAQRYFPDRVLTLPADLHPEVWPAFLEKHRDCAGALISAAHNETGLLLPWKPLARQCAASAVPFLLDASQYIGRLPMQNIAQLGVWIACSAHKYGGPAGVGWVYVGEGADGFCLQEGGGQEQGMRSGTVSVGLIAAAVAQWGACESALTLTFIQEKLQQRLAFEEALMAAVPGTQIVGVGLERLWNTTAAILPGPSNIRWQQRLDRLGFCVGTGAACGSSKKEPSPGLLSLGVDEKSAQQFLRISSGLSTNAQDYAMLAQAFNQAFQFFNGEENASVLIDL